MEFYNMPSAWKTNSKTGNHFQDLPRGIDAKTFNKLQQQDKGRSLGFHEKFINNTSDHSGLTFGEIDALLAAVNYLRKGERFGELDSRPQQSKRLKKALESASDKLENGLRTTYPQ